MEAMLDYSMKQAEAPFQTDLLDTTANGDHVQEPGIPLMPATYRTDSTLHSVAGDVHGFLNSELNVERLNEIHDWLWLVGLPSAPRPLHYQVLKKRNIVVTEQLDLHLVWASSASSSSIFIKPLPRFMLSPIFWQTHICPYRHLYETALGLLLSFVTLIEREVDFHMALHHGLIPKEITWPGWLKLVEEVLRTSRQAKSFLNNPTTGSAVSLGSYPTVNRRFYYGELRLGRLNWIWRLMLGQPRGYLSGCTTYGAFMRDNVNSLITLFAYTTIVLSAMQVGLATESLSSSHAFGVSSYVFSVFAIVAPLVFIIGIFAIMCFMFVFNLVRTMKVRNTRRRRGAGV